jgi:hypothetical protein
MAHSDALNLLTSTRQSFLIQSSIEALTRGGPNGLPRPNELHAQDPTRYVGDMLSIDTWGTRVPGSIVWCDESSTADGW